MTKNEIVTEIFESAEYDLIFDKLMNKKFKDLYKEDFKQELGLILLEMKDNLIIDLYKNNRLKFYVVRICLNQINSSTSPFYKKFRKESLEKTNHNLVYCHNYLDNVTDNDTDDFRWLKLDNNILKYLQSNNILTWYELNILSIYYRLGEYSNEIPQTYRSIEKEYGIAFASIFNTIKISIGKIKEHLNI